MSLEYRDHANIRLLRAAAVHEAAVSSSPNIQPVDIRLR